MDRPGPDKNKRNLKTAARLSGLAVQMGLTIFLANRLGIWLDDRYGLDYLETTLTLFGIFASMYTMIRQATRWSN